MKFARVVFTIAGVWGIVVLTPLYWMTDKIGRQYPPPITHLDFFFGFLAVTIAWQVAFMVIAWDPVRFRPFMIPATLEKFLYVATLAVLYARGDLQPGQAMVAGPDLLLGVLFVTAFARTSSNASARPGGSAANA